MDTTANPVVETALDSPTKTGKHRDSVLALGGGSLRGDVAHWWRVSWFPPVVVFVAVYVFTTGHLALFTGMGMGPSYVIATRRREGYVAQVRAPRPRRPEAVGVMVAKRGVGNVGLRGRARAVSVGRRGAWRRGRGRPHAGGRHLRGRRRVAPRVGAKG